MQIIRNSNNLAVDWYYDGDGFFSTVFALSTSELSLWSDFQTVVNELKEN